MIVLCEILVIVFIAAKFISVGGFLNKMHGTGVVPWFLSSALADPSSRGLGMPLDVDEQLTGARKLLASLTERQQQLDSREGFLKAEERRLDALKREIIQKLENLKALEEKLSVPLEASATADDKRFKDLAKVYEAAPPQQVGSILEKMDTKTAAGILMNMNSKKAGAIWGHLNPARSVEIAKEITTAQSASGAKP